MTENGRNRSVVIPSRTYRNAPEAIEWLCSVFGFEKHAVYAGPNNTIAHAELTFGGGMIMLGSSSNEVGDSAEKAGRGDTAEAGSVNLIVDNADAVFERAKAGDALILVDIEDKPYGGRGFACHDLEGYVWHVGTYDPWQPK